MHLPGQTNPGHLRCGNSCFGQKAANAGGGLIPPILGMLLRPTGMRLQERVFFTVAAGNSAVLGHQNALDGRSAEINAQEIVHRIVLLV
ncbi:hypothetical protein D3C76_1717890 [compost metagenome]